MEYGPVKREIFRKIGNELDVEKSIGSGLKIQQEIQPSGDRIKVQGTRQRIQNQIWKKSRSEIEARR